MQVLMKILMLNQVIDYFKLCTLICWKSKKILVLFKILYSSDHDNIQDEEAMMDELIMEPESEEGETVIVINPDEVLLASNIPLESTIKNVNRRYQPQLLRMPKSRALCTSKFVYFIYLL